MRINICKDYKSFTLNQWKNEIFSDETQIILKCFPINVRFLDQYVTKTVKCRGFFKWGTIAGYDTRMLKSCPERPDSTKYQSASLKYKYTG